jgi:hypothetical protein
VSSLVLLTSQRNEVFKTIQDSGFVPSDFEWAEVESRHGFSRVPQLRHIPTGYYFSIERGEIDYNETGFFVSYSPGLETQHDGDTSGTWVNVVKAVAFWLKNVRRETELPDLWDSLEGGNQLLQDDTEQSSDNLPFTQAELPQIRIALEEIKTYVLKTKDLTEAQRNIVNARFSHMEEAATRMGRKDWLSLVVGSLLGVAFNIALNGDSTRDLFGFAALILKRVLGAMLYLGSPH